MRRLLLACAGFAATPLLVWCFASLAGLALGRDLHEWAKHDAAHPITRSVLVATELHRREQQRVPTTDEGLSSLVPEYIAGIPRDPWARPLIYKTQGADWADIVSLGRDGAPGGYGLDTDVSARYGSPSTSPPRLINLALVGLLGLLPLGAYALARLRPRWLPLLAGVAGFWGYAVCITVAPDAAASLGLIAAFAAVVTAFSGALVCAQRLPGGPAMALAGTLLCQVACAWMIGAIA